MGRRCRHRHLDRSRSRCRSRSRSRRKCLRRRQRRRRCLLKARHGCRLWPTASSAQVTSLLSCPVAAILPMGRVPLHRWTLPMVWQQPRPPGRRHHAVVNRRRTEAWLKNWTPSLAPGRERTRGTPASTRRRRRLRSSLDPALSLGPTLSPLGGKREPGSGLCLPLKLADRRMACPRRPREAAAAACTAPPRLLNRVVLVPLWPRLRSSLSSRSGPLCPTQLLRRRGRRPQEVATGSATPAAAPSRRMPRPPLA
mmetsp:Transcript_123399/g.348682  ORF Transcript_123399/g.348682 Transcript_123399/m.348682 type:complete len:254 (-) Transcript_123399:589-1350(-)